MLGKVLTVTASSAEAALVRALQKGWCRAAGALIPASSRSDMPHPDATKHGTPKIWLWTDPPGSSAALACHKSVSQELPGGPALPASGTWA